MIRGQVTHTAAGGGTVELVEGDTVTIPKDVWHDATSTGAEPAVLFIAFSSADRETIGEWSAYDFSRQ